MEKKKDKQLVQGRTLFVVTSCFLQHHWAQKHQKASVLYDYPDHTPAPGFSLSASVPQAGVGCTEAGAARVIRAACLCSAVMSLRLCSAVMSFLHNEGPQGSAGEGG